MSGFMQGSFFFGYMAVVCFGFFLMLGTVGWRASLMFVRHIYKVFDFMLQMQMIPAVRVNIKLHATLLLVLTAYLVPHKYNIELCHVVDCMQNLSMFMHV